MFMGNSVFSGNACRPFVLAEGWLSGDAQRSLWAGQFSQHSSAWGSYQDIDRVWRGILVIQQADFHFFLLWQYNILSLLSAVFLFCGTALDINISAMVRGDGSSCCWHSLKRGIYGSNIFVSDSLPNFLFYGLPAHPYSPFSGDNGYLHSWTFLEFYDVIWLIYAGISPRSHLTFCYCDPIHMPPEFYWLHWSAFISFTIFMVLCVNAFIYLFI